MSQVSLLYTTGIMLSCLACDYPVDNLPLYAGYWPVRLAPVAATPPLCFGGGGGNCCT